MKTTVLITGASRGIGAAIAIEYAKKGYRLVLTCSKSSSELSALQEQLKKEYQVEVLTSVGNIGDGQYVKELFDSIQDRFGGIDILINNAGVSHIGLLQDMELEEWNDLIQVNLTAVFLTSKYAIHQMLTKQSGKIINISSVWGEVGASCEVAYSATKGALNTFTKALGKELAPSNIQVNAIACGCVDTKMNACFSEEEKRILTEEIPAGRFATPQEVAQFVLQLTESPSYLTGQVITMDGGWI